MNRLSIVYLLTGLLLLIAPRHVFSQTHFKFTANTSDSYSILVNATRLDGVSLEAGDEVGVFTPQGLCVGATQLSGAEVFALAAWIDDPQTSGVDGYTVGDTMHFKIWDASRNMEVEAYADSFLAGDGTFGSGPLARIDTLAATINKPPTLNLPGSFVINEDDTTQVLALDNHVNDIDNADAELSWTVAGTANIQARYDSAKREVRWVPAPNWNGSDIIKLTVKDPLNATSVGNLPVTVMPVNDPPSLQLPAAISFNEDETPTLMLDSYVTDIDNASAEMTWTVTSSDPANLAVRYDAAKRTAQLTPASNWNGSLVLSMKVEDPGRAAASGTLPVTITPVNDAPSIPQLLTPVWLQTGAVLKWTKSVDPDAGDVIRYQIQIAADSAFPAGTINQTAANEELAINAIGSQLAIGKIYYWRVQALDQQNASAGFSAKWSFRYEGNNVVTEVEERQPVGLPLAFALHQSYPNPVRQMPNTQTAIRFDLPRAEHVTLQIFNLLGQRVRELMNAGISPGIHHIIWDGRDDSGNLVKPGFYFYRLEIGKINLAKRLVVIQ